MKHGCLLVTRLVNAEDELYIHLFMDMWYIAVIRRYIEVKYWEQQMYSNETKVEYPVHNLILLGNLLFSQM